MLFDAGRNPTSTGSVNPDKIDNAIAELDAYTDFFNRMVLSCHNKCIGTRYADGDLNKGESVCIDRCVVKFSEVQKKVQDKLQAKAQANANLGGGAGGAGGFAIRDYIARI
ncbi:protein transporter tim10 [Leucoagaricus gongylophorus]